jgi:hypothetical protein
MVRVLSILALIAVGVPALLYCFWFVHRTLDRLCVRHARRFCRRNGLKILRVRWRPEFEPSGVKTESTLVQLDCRDEGERRRLVLLKVWPFGFRKIVSNEEYPEAYDRQWPLGSD